ncbi:hypothetical protein SporoS204_13425 [Sporosarcina ureae]|uniref:Uncharacterized protein n=1 Tax=Sporosarcina ureae TaxID=1571 RepID=A0ABM6JYK1_SPOUR|nr:hypothetical protein SporoS204_13425 [Sporosarcina ureae]
MNGEVHGGCKGIEAPAGDAFRRAWLEPSEQRRVRFAVFLCTLQKLRHLSRFSRRTLILSESPQLPLQSYVYSGGT